MPFVSHSLFCPALLFTVINISRQECRIKHSLPSEAMMFIYYVYLVIISQGNFFTLCLFSAMDKVLSPRSWPTLNRTFPHIFLRLLSTLKIMSFFPWGSTPYSNNTVLSCKFIFVPSTVQWCAKWLKWTFQEHVTSGNIGKISVMPFFQFSVYTYPYIPVCHC